MSDRTGCTNFEALKAQRGCPLLCPELRRYREADDWCNLNESICLLETGDRRQVYEEYLLKVNDERT